MQNPHPPGISHTGKPISGFAWNLLAHCVLRIRGSFKTQRLFYSPERLSISSTCMALSLSLMFFVSPKADGVEPAKEEQKPSESHLVFSDTLLPGASRSVGANVNGTFLTAEDEVKWLADKEITITEHGASGSGGAYHAFPSAVTGTVRLQADVIGKGSDFTGLVLGADELGYGIWKNLIMAFYIKGNGYNLTIASKTGDKNQFSTLISKPDAALLKADAPNHLELQVDTTARTVSASINGTPVLDSVSLPPEVQLSNIRTAGFRFNPPATAGLPSVSNYHVEAAIKAGASKGPMVVRPVDPDMWFVVPDKTATLSWRVSNAGSDKVSYLITDYEGREVERGDAALSPDRTVTITRIFPRGYHEIIFPETNQSFGIVALEPHTGSADPFFGMDAGLSAPEIGQKDLQRREVLVKTLARCGIAVARERMSQGSVNPAKDKFNWDGLNAYESLRKTYADNHISILDVLQGGPRPFPELAASTVEVVKHWQNCWAGVEVENEPDLGRIPADQYALLVKTQSYAFAKAETQVPLVTGVFAVIPPGPYYDVLSANGMLEDSNAVGFHLYQPATDIEGSIARLRTWLKKSNKEAMPLWLTESGWPWLHGPERPPRDLAAMSALETSAKAVEAKACGIERYFAFLYTYLEEGPKTWGMMGRELSPLRGMAAYATCVQALSGKKYLGDIQGLDSTVKLARVFGGTDNEECVAVLYTGRPDSGAKVPFPIKLKRATGADGRTVQLAEGSLPLPDGLAYVWLDSSDVQKSLKTDTNAKRLSQIGRHPLEQKRLASPLVLEFLAKLTPSQASGARYLVTQETAQKFPLNVRVHNLSQAPMDFIPKLTLPGKKVEEAAPVTVPAMGHSDVAWNMDITPYLDIAETRLVTVSGKSKDGIVASPLAIPVVMAGTLEQHLKRYTKQIPLPITDLSRWQPDIAGHGTSTFSVTKEGAWRMDVKFSGVVDNWVYPRFRLPEKIDPAASSGLLVRARVFDNARNVAIIADSDGGVPSFWVSDLFPPDGNWHVVYIPFTEFKPGPISMGNQNTLLDPTLWKKLRMGMGSRTSENGIEVSHLILVGGGSE